MEMSADQYEMLMNEEVDKWNQWRRENPHERIVLHGVMFVSDQSIDLSNADLSGAELSHSVFSQVDLASADFIRANLSYSCFGGPDRIHVDILPTDLSNCRFMHADLSFSDLSETIITGADFRLADLRSANFTDAEMSNADLSQSDLSGARFRNTNLTGTILRGANLTGATFDGVDMSTVDLSDATIADTIFADADLRQTKGLLEIHHAGPCTIGLDTIFRSRGEIAEDFLKQCGVPSAFIEYMRSLVNSVQPIEYLTVFISYSSNDEEFVKQLYKDLQKARVRCWYAPESLEGGDWFHHRIERSIQAYDKLLVVLSSNALTSPWVEREVISAREKEDSLRRDGVRSVCVYPITIDNAIWETAESWALDIRRQRHIVDFTGWRNLSVYRSKLERVLHDIQEK